jgi:hypothetical protein
MVMRARSGSRCKRCITLVIGGRIRDSDINDSVREGGGGGVALVVGVKEKANVSRAGGEGSRDEVVGFDGDGVAGDNETNKGGEFAADRAKGVADGIDRGGFVVAAGKKVVAVGVKGVVAEAAGGTMGKELGENGQAEAPEEAQAVVGGGEAVVGIEAGEIVEGRGHHAGVGKGGKVGANVGRDGERGGEGGEILGLEAAVDVTAEVSWEADGAVSEVKNGGRSVEGRKWEARREEPAEWKRVLL